MAIIGKMDRRIVIEVRTAGKDATGTRTESWATDATVWAQLVRNSGKQMELADGDRTQTVTQWRIRNRTIDETAYRITYNSKTYEIKGVTIEGRSDTLLIDTVATQAIA